MITRKIKYKIFLSLFSLGLLVLGGCKESLPLVESDLDGTWYTDKGISKVDETIWLFRGWSFIYSTDELDRYGGFKSEALRYRNQFSGVVIKRTEKNGIRVGNANLGVWVLDKDFTSPAVNILWLSNENGSNGSDRAHFALDKKGVRNLIHNDLTFRNSGASRTLTEQIIIFAIIGAIIGALVQYFYTNKKPIKDEPSESVRKKRKKTASKRKGAKPKSKKEPGFELKIEKENEKDEGFSLKKDQYLKNKRR